MKFMGSLLIFFCAANALAFEPCATNLGLAAAEEHVRNHGKIHVKVLDVEMGAWTEALGNNVGSATVTLKAGTRVYLYEVIGKQIGSSTDCKATEVKMSGAQD